MIDIKNITVRIGGKVLLEQASAHISDNQKVGLVGLNGCGKTTLFRILQGEYETELGEVYFPEHSKVAYVKQEINDTTVKILDFVLAQDKERTKLMKKLQTADSSELGEIHERLKMIEADSAPARASAILNGLGFANDDFSKTVAEFSGGWRMRLALAAALFQPSDILLLDEPTNHLDLEAAIWLTAHLQKYKGTLLIISHDRTILNDVCDYIIHFDNKKLVTYNGNYDRFLTTRAEQKEMLERTYKKQQQKRKHLESFVERFRYKASKAKQAQSRIKLLEKMPTVTLLEDETSIGFDFPEPQEISSPIINMEDVSTGYGDKAVLKNLNLSIEKDDRIALLGANGNGKSTFAKLLSEKLTPMTGTLRRTPKLKIGYFAQHQSEELPYDKTATEYMAEFMPDKTETQVRAYLGRFGLVQEKSQTKIANLSGGEKARLLIASMSIDAPNLLILDEPTNHLDMDSRDALVEALNDYKGAVLLITHDMHTIELVADELWLVNKGTCKVYDGDLEDYKKLLLEKTESKAEKKKKEAEEQQKEIIKAQKQEKKNKDKEQKQKLRNLEKELSLLEKRKAEIEKSFETFQSAEDTIALQKEFKQIEERIAAAEEEWLKLSSEEE